MRKSLHLERVLGLLGIAARAGAVVMGTERVRERIRNGDVRLVVVASDASNNSRAKVLPLLQALRLPYMVAFSRAELGAAVGKSSLSVLAVTRESLAARVAELFKELSEQGNSFCIDRW